MQSEREQTLVSVLIADPLPSLYWWAGRIKMASASTPSGNEPAKDLSLVHTVQLKPMTKAQLPGRMISSGTSNVAIISVHSDKSRLKKLMKINIIIITIIIIMNK